jgi:hypothetical protein
LESELQAAKTAPAEAPAAEGIKDVALLDADQPTRAEKPQFRRQPLRWLWVAVRLDADWPRVATRVEDLHFQGRLIKWLARGVLRLRSLQDRAVYPVVLVVPVVIAAGWIIAAVGGIGWKPWLARNSQTG